MFGFSKKKKATSYQLFSKASRRSHAGNGWSGYAMKHSASVAKRNSRRKRGLFK